MEHLQTQPLILQAQSTPSGLKGDWHPYEQLRPVASAGAPGLIKAAFQLTQQDALYATLRERFLLSYANNIAVKTTLFAGIPELLKQLRKTGIGWGIVTNKVSSLTHPLVKKIGLDDADCVISGDTAARAKPFPDPLFAAAEALDVAPGDCWFVGDDLRDIQAGKSAGTAFFLKGKVGKLEFDYQLINISSYGYTSFFVISFHQAK